MSARKSSHGTIFLIVSSGSPLALIASSLRSTSKKPVCPMTRSLHPPMAHCGQRVRFAATWREEFFEVPITLFAVSARRGGELADALTKSIGEHPDALFAMNNGLNLTYRKVIIEFAAEHRLPVMHSFTEATRDGGLLSYATDRPALFRHAAVLAGKILKGANPADMPIEQPTGFQLAINLRTAK